MMHSVAMALWLVAPVALAGLAHVAVIKLRLFPSLARVRLDFGRTWRGKPVFGDNKTWRGALVMPLATAAFVLLQISLLPHWPWATGLAPTFQVAHPLIWGLLAGAGYIAGELPNSFVKRQLGLAAGATAAGGGAAPVLWVIDQVDSVLGFLLFILPVWTPPAAVVLALLAVTLVVHPVVAFIMYCLGLKTRVG
jgi:hypothetical protein